MNRAVAVVLTTLCLVGSASDAGALDPAMPKTPGDRGAAAERVASDLEVFTRANCPHCAAATEFLQALRRERPALVIAMHDVGEDAGARARLEGLATRAGIRPAGVPAFVIGDRLIVGFRSAATTGRELRALLEGRASASHTAAADVQTECPAGSGVPCGSAGSDDAIELPWIGRLAPRDLGLVAFTVALGLADGFNACAMWLLLFLLSLLVNVHDRRRMALVAGTFVAVSGIAYFAFMVAWLNVFLLVGIARETELALGVIAIVFGSINVKDFVVFGRGVSLSIPQSAKPGLYGRARRVLQAQSFAASLAAVTALALVANAVELLCTAGLPAVYTRILTLHALPAWQYYAYLALYNVAYVFDDSVMVILAVVSLRRFKLTERAGRWLKLASGAVMLVLGLVLVFSPHWLAGTTG